MSFVAISASFSVTHDSGTEEQFSNEDLRLKFPWKNNPLRLLTKHFAIINRLLMKNLALEAAKQIYRLIFCLAVSLLKANGKHWPKSAKFLTAVRDYLHQCT